jgi:hypothetical protein
MQNLNRPLRTKPRTLSAARWEKDVTKPGVFNLADLLSKWEKYEQAFRCYTMCLQPYRQATRRSTQELLLPTKQWDVGGRRQSGSGTEQSQERHVGRGEESNLPQPVVAGWQIAIAAGENMKNHSQPTKQV